MSDDYPAYYNAWIEVMNKPDHRLICAWHIMHSWKKNYNLVQSASKKERVKIMMRSLITETDENTFKTLMTETLKSVWYPCPPNLSISNSPSGQSAVWICKKIRKIILISH